MTEKKHDLIVIGAGPGGYVAAIRAAQLGMNVAVVEKESALGGTCLRVGCIPSKALLESSARFWQAKNDLKTHGVTATGVKLNLSAMLKRKNQVVDNLCKGVESLFKKNKITRYHGQGRLAGQGKVVVEGKKEKTELRADHVLIASGSKPAPLKGVKMKGDRIATSTEALSYKSVPKHLIVIGAGYIGLELGSVWRRLGAKVTVLEFLDRILPGMDLEIAREAQKIFEDQGLEFRLGSKVTGAEVKGQKCHVKCEGKRALTCDHVLLAVGRIPNTDDLGLDSVDLKLDEHGRIPVNENFATEAEGVYAIGDVIAGPMLAHKAQEEGVACAEFLAGRSGRVDYNAIPGVVYTHPEIASVGKTEEQLKEEKVDYHKGVFFFRASGRAQTLGETNGRVKILADSETDRILGVHILGPDAGDLINEAAVAMAFGASSEDLARCCHAHPTLAEALKEAALAVDKRAIHS